MIGFLMPWIGPIVAWAVPQWARARMAAGSLAGMAGPLIGLAVVAATVLGAVWLLKSGRDGALKAEGRAECATQVSTVTVEQLSREMLRRQMAESAADEARDAARETEAAFQAKIASLEGDLASRPAKALCYPADVARKLNR